MSRPFSAWREGVPQVVVPILLGLGTLAILIKTPYWYVALPFLAAGAFALFFFRDPARRVTAGPGEIVSPADGAVVAVEDLEESPHYEGPCKRVSIFLSIFSVHVNRAPADGSVTRIEYRLGRHGNAMKAESSRVNESNAIWMDTPHGPMTVRQISGAVARRIVCVAESGENLAKGQKIGMIKFGSRTELYLPPHAEVRVAEKEKVRAGTSVVATVAAREPVASGYEDEDAHQED